MEVRDLGFSYAPSPGRPPVRALADLTFSIRRGEAVLVRGPSGSGKSTLCRALMGLVPHTTPGSMDGTVRVAGMETRDHPVNALASAIGMVFQDPDTQLFSSTVEDEIAFGLEQSGADEAAMETAVDAAIARLGIERLRHRPIDALSWGERQRVAIAATMATAPSVLVLDEPLSGLDGGSAAALVATLAALRRETDLAVIVAEHRTELLGPLADRELVLDGGRIVADRPTPALAPAPQAARPPAPYRPAGAAPSVELQDLCVRYPGHARRALDRVSLALFPGEVTVLAGSNGSGKSTLLRMLNGLLVPERGTVAVLSRPVAGRPVAELAREVGVLFQGADYQLFADTIAGEIAFAPRNFGVDEQEIARRTADAVGALGLGAIPLEASPLSLSVGERQRVAIASVLAMETPVVALDEPTLGLDRPRKEALADLLRELARAGRTVLVVTHDRPFADACADREVTMADGGIVADAAGGAA
ncbi:MAG: ABC transporter ATP-binding protein [Methanospirillum sp.]